VGAVTSQTPSEPDAPTSTRRDRQRAVIGRLLDAHQLSRAADLAHEHLAEFPGDDALRRTVVSALLASPDPYLHRRAAQLARA